MWDKVSQGRWESHAWLTLSWGIEDSSFQVSRNCSENTRGQSDYLLNTLIKNCWGVRENNTLVLIFWLPHSGPQDRYNASLVEIKPALNIFLCLDPVYSVLSSVSRDSISLHHSVSRGFCRRVVRHNELLNFEVFDIERDPDRSHNLTVPSIWEPSGTIRHALWEWVSLLCF